MAGKKPLFVSAPRLILGTEDVNGKFTRLGYAIGLSLRISVNVQPINVLGSFSPIGYEPVMYQPVQLTMQIIKLQKLTTRNARTAASKQFYNNNPFIDYNNIKQNADDFNFSADQNLNTDNQINLKNPSNSVIEQADIFKHLDPVQILQSKSFDVKIYLNIDGYGDQVSTIDNVSFKSQFIPGTDRISTQTLAEFMTVKDCRLTSRNVNIQVGQLLNEPVTAMGLLAVHNGEKLDSLIQEGSV